MHPKAMIPANRMPQMTEGNHIAEEMPLTTRGNPNFHGRLTSSSHAQANLANDNCPPTLGDQSTDVSDNELSELPVEDQGNNRIENQDAQSENAQLDEQSDEHPANGNPRKRKHYHRHTQNQIKEMEDFFKDCPHPDEKQRKELGHKLGLHPLQVKFWFQNKRTQMKTKHERKENTKLRVENQNLRCENLNLKKSFSIGACNKCGTPCNVVMSSDVHQLMLENARLTEEIERVTATAKNAFRNIGKSLASSSTLSSSLNQGSLEFGPGAFGGQLGNTPFGDITPSSQSFRPLNGSSEPDKSLVIEHAVSAMQEVATMARTGEPLWIPDPDRDILVLNEQEYMKIFQRGFAPKPIGFKSESSRASAVVMMNPLNILQIFMELSKWLAVFSGVISRAKLLELLSTGVAGNFNGTLQLISAEFQVLCPGVPTRECIFVRYCKQLAEGTWAVIDVSVDALLCNSSMTRCRRRPSGCIVQAMPNGCSKITWVEHVEVQDHIIHSLSRSIINSGYAYGAKRWISILERQCERIVSAMGITSYPHFEDLNEIVLAHPKGRQSVLKLAERMVLSFYSGVTASSGDYNWITLSGNGVDEVKIMTRKSMDDPGRPGGLVISASICFWIPILPKTVFDYIHNESTRAEWDILSNRGGVQELAYIGNGQEPGNCVTVLRKNPHTNHGNMLILQESSIEPTTSFIVYAPVDAVSINMLFEGGNPDIVQLLPSGFTILPSGPPSSEGGDDDDGITSGTLLTIAFQILADSAPYAEPSSASVATVKNFIKSTTEKIKIALDKCSYASCVSDLDMMCPMELRVRSHDKRIVVAYKSAWLAFNSPRCCYTGSLGNPRSGKPTAYSKIVKASCPKAYSYYAYDRPPSITFL